MEQLRNAGFAITICDKDGKILDMNARSKQTFAKYGDIIGHSLFEYHPPRAAEILRGLLENHNVNAYTIEKEGLHKLIYQVPWYEENGDFGGYVELSLVIPAEMPHYVRQLFVGTHGSCVRIIVVQFVFVIVGTLGSSVRSD